MLINVPPVSVVSLDMFMHSTPKCLIINIFPHIFCQIKRKSYRFGTIKSHQNNLCK